jgi:serine/threonine-protein kinase
MTIEAGAMVGRYRVLRRLGAGAMGDVYLAIDDALGRQAALKLLSTKHLKNDVVRERFLREARALARLSHPNLITVYEAGHVGESQRPYFAMELLEGGDTQQLLDSSGPLPSGTVALIGAQAAAGLGEAARAGITHRDVKPSNLGINAQGVLKVTDFSLAKSYLVDKSLTGRGLVVGTADYIAPEQARGEELDERADVYALGCTLFHLLTGRPPYRAEEGTEVRRYVEVMKAHLSEPVPNPRDYVPGMNEDLVEIVRASMIKDRDDRPTFMEIAGRLAKLSARLGGELPRAGRSQFSLPASTTSPAASELEHDDGAAPVPGTTTQALMEAGVTGRPWPKIALAAGLILSLAAAAAALLR